MGAEPSEEVAVVEQIFEGGAKDMPTAEVNSTTSSARRIVVGCEDSEDAARRTIRLFELEANVFGMACAWPEHGWVKLRRT
jgi:hypothetical protein